MTIPFLARTFFQPIAKVLLVLTLAVPITGGAVDFGQVATRVATILQHEHYNDHSVDDEISQELLTNYLEYLDLARLYFLQGDIEFFEAKFAMALDDHLREQDISPAKEIFEIYERRVIDRITKVKRLIAEEEFSFESDRELTITRKDLPWPATPEEADQVWYNLIEGEFLQEHLRLSGEDDEEAVDIKGIRETIAKRYDRILETLQKNTEEDIAGSFLKSLAHAYDPHSEYFTQSEYNNFRISMQKSLEGIGALLAMTEDGYAEIRGLVVNGPAHRGGELKVGDRIVSVGQGPKKPADIKGMKLQDVVDLIRGKRGSTVVLEVIPNGEDPSVTDSIQIRRGRVDLKQSLARAELIETRDERGEEVKLGWIDLPSFYSDMETGQTSVTKDTRRLLTRLVHEGIDGLVLDLRDNGGGSLEEAINLTGLFIPKGPVVQSKDSRNRIEVKNSRSARPAYEGPLVVLTSKSSASASEILAAALQDYNRAVIVGEASTFGKGTVQQLVPVTTNNFALLLPGAGGNQAGALKLTIQKFYRIAGGSTQGRGVVPDVKLPSLSDAVDHGELSLKNPLPYDEIPAQRFSLFEEEALPLEDLKMRSSVRVAEDPDFQWIMEESARIQERREKNVISFNEEFRRQELEDQKVTDDQRWEDIKKRYAETKMQEEGLFRTYSITLDTVGQPTLPLLSSVTSDELSGMMTEEEEKTEEQKALEPPHGFGNTKREAIAVLQDLIRLQLSKDLRKITLKR
ncbi:MAG: carboxy terminal-processing peptidase [Verrucomicrobiota bacterium]